MSTANSTAGARCSTVGRRRGSPDPSWHFVGTQIAEREAFDAVPEGIRSESVNGVYPELIARRSGAIRVFRAQT